MGGLSTHKILHRGEKKFECDHPECNFKSPTKERLVVHKRVHNGKKPYICDYEGCSFATTQSGILVIHKRAHYGLRPFTCDHPGCNYKSTQNANLLTHKRTHTSFKPYVCNILGCTYKSRALKDLTVHTRIHTGEKPHVCDYPGCSYKTTTCGILAAHKRSIHVGEKNHICDYPGCDYAGSQSGNLLMHKRIHSPDGEARQKIQEQRVANALKNAGIEFKREHRVDFSCIGDSDNSYARIDFVIIRNGHVIFLEVDEHQHKFGYGSISCDMRRMSTIVESLCLEGNDLPVIFIRYNPHSYTVDGISVSRLKRDRESMLIDILNKSSTYVNKPLSIMYMFYDTSDETPHVVTSLEYDSIMALCCCSPII